MSTVVTGEAVVLELPGRVQQPGDRRDAVVAQEGDRRALVEVPGEVVARGQGDDAVAVGVEVQAARQTLACGHVQGQRRLVGEGPEERDQPEAEWS